jgi:hypothetical protein
MRRYYASIPATEAEALAAVDELGLKPALAEWVAWQGSGTERGKPIEAGRLRA